MIRFLTVMFLTVSLLFIGCTKKDENVYRNAASECLKKQDIRGAVENYNKIAEEFPDSPSAPKALYDIAGLYQNKMDRTMDPTASLNRAIEYFNKVVEKYPKSKEAPLALFNTGFVQANELKKYDDAKKSYSKFLADYPNHEMAVAAKQEIDYMGVAPETIIQNKIAGKK
jgi:TolA-binding protein